MAENTAQQVKQKAIAFSLPEQITRILSEVSQLSLEVLVRFDKTGKAVRARVFEFAPAHRSITLVGISPAGEQALKTVDSVTIEFVLLSTKLKFISKVVSRAPGRIILEMPARMLSVERRANARFKVPVSHAAFIELKDATIDTNRFDAPYLPKKIADVKPLPARLRIDDVSLGGMAGFTRFNAISQLLAPGETIFQAHLCLPNMPPMQVPVSIRWMKKTTVNVPPHEFSRFRECVAHKLQGSVPLDKIALKEIFYRVGIQFPEISKDLDAALRSYIKMVQTAESL